MSRFRMCRFPRLRELREELGWELTDLLGKLPEAKPGLSSLSKLERGLPLRYTNVKRVFDTVNEAYGGSLDPKKELKVVK